MDIERQLSGASNAGKFIVTYSDDPDRKPDFEPFQLSDAHNQYQFLSEEVTSKIMVGHRVTSPQMFGVAVPGKLGGGGELAEASELFEKNVIAPARQVVTEAVKTLLRAAGLDAQLVQLSEEPQEVNLDGCVDYLTDKGEEMSDEWELIDESPVDYDLEKARDAMWAFARAIVPEAKPSNRRQERTRHRDYQGAICLRSRNCLTQADSPRLLQEDGQLRVRVYRKEDIESASRRAVNPGLGEGGSNTYDLFLFKGGARCHHFWSRQDIRISERDNKKISVNQAKKLIREAGVDAKRLPENDKRVAQRPVDMPNEGFINPR